MATFLMANAGFTPQSINFLLVSLRMGGKLAILIPPSPIIFSSSQPASLQINICGVSKLNN